MTAVDVSASVSKYRDVARGLWNNAFLPMVKADLPDDPRSEWDIRDEFEDLCVEIFSNLVLFPVGAGKLRIAPSYRADGAVLSELKVIPHEHADLLVAESEGNSFRSYDLSISVASDAQLDLRFRAFFDYWELGLRDLEYCHAVVAACPDRPQFVGRNVLVRATQAKYELSAL